MDQQMTQQQSKAADAAQALTDLLQADPLVPTDADQVLKLVKRATDAALELVATLELLELQGGKQP